MHYRRHPLKVMRRSYSSYSIKEPRSTRKVDISVMRCRRHPAEVTRKSCSFYSIKGAEVNAQGGEYSNALQAASEGGHEGVVKLLLATDQVDPDSKDKDGWAPLLWAAANGHEARGALRKFLR
jgi:ankyrin repeat protein